MTIEKDVTEWPPGFPPIGELLKRVMPESNQEPIKMGNPQLTRFDGGRVTDVALVSYCNYVTQTIYKINPRARPFAIEAYVSECQKHLAPFIKNICNKYPNVEVAICYYSRDDSSRNDDARKISEHTSDLINVIFLPITMDPKKLSERSRMIIDRSCGFRSF